MFSNDRFFFEFFFVLFFSLHYQHSYRYRNKRRVICVTVIASSLVCDESSSIFYRKSSTEIWKLGCIKCVTRIKGDESDAKGGRDGSIKTI